MISYAQNLEDVLLARAFRGQQTGFYIDVGAMDPVEGSITKHFYDLGWQGINIEPDPRFHARLVEARPRDVNLKVGVGEKPESRIFYWFDEQGISTCNPEFADYFLQRGRTCRLERQEMTTLAEVCRTHVRGPIDFLKIDAEGWEGPILEGADWTAYHPRIVLLESTQPFSHTPAWEGWEPFLLNQGYAFVYFDGLNRFYVHDASAGLAGAFRFPPNVLDAYQLHATVVLEERLQAAEAGRASEAEQGARLTVERERAVEAGTRAEAEVARLSGELAQATAAGTRDKAETVRLSAELAWAAQVAAGHEAEAARLTVELAQATELAARHQAEIVRLSAESAQAGARYEVETAQLTAELARAGEAVAWHEAEEARLSLSLAQANTEAARHEAAAVRLSAELAQAAEQAAEIAARHGAEAARLTGELAQACAAGDRLAAQAGQLAKELQQALTLAGRLSQERVTERQQGERLAGQLREALAQGRELRAELERQREEMERLRIAQSPVWAR